MWVLGCMTKKVINFKMLAKEHMQDLRNDTYQEEPHLCLSSKTNKKYLYLSDPRKNYRPSYFRVVFGVQPPVRFDNTRTNKQINKPIKTQNKRLI